jgi:hypothetical protein
MLAQVPVQNAKLPEALELAIKAVKLEPAEQRHRWVICRILLAMNRYGEASKIAENVLATADTEMDRWRSRVVPVAPPDRDDSRIFPGCPGKEGKKGGRGKRLENPGGGHPSNYSYYSWAELMKRSHNKNRWERIFVERFQG